MSVLGALLIRRDAIDHLNGLRLEHFSDRRCREVYASRMSLNGDGVPIDPVMLELDLSRRGALEAVGGLAFLSDLVHQVPTADNVDHYARIVEDAGRARILDEKMSELLGLLRAER